MNLHLALTLTQSGKLVAVDIISPSQASDHRKATAMGNYVSEVYPIEGLKNAVLALKLYQRAVARLLSGPIKCPGRHASEMMRAQFSGAEAISSLSQPKTEEEVGA